MATYSQAASQPLIIMSSSPTPVQHAPVIQMSYGAACNNTSTQSQSGMSGYTCSSSQPLIVSPVQHAPMLQTLSHGAALNSIPAVQPSLSSISDTGHTQANSGKIVGSEMYTPNVLSKASNQLGANVSQSLKQKIASGEYIDLALLLSNSSSTSSNENQKVAFVQGELVIQPKQSHKKITTVELWTDAFIIYMSIFCSAHPGKVNEFLKYMHLIRLGANRSPFGWQSYDEQFRLRASQNPLISWAEIDSELWLIYMYGSVGIPPTPVNNNNNSKVYKCYAYNFDGQCSRFNCPYSHCCVKCFGQHPVKSCFRQQGNRAVNPTAQRFIRPPIGSNGRGFIGSPRLRPRFN